MPTFNIVRESKIVPSFRVAQIRGMYDYSRESVRHEWTSVLPLEEKKWGIGLIVGPSGCGKTTLAQTAFDSFYFHTRATGFIFGHIVSFDTTNPIDTKGWRTEEMSKVGLLTTLFQVFRLATHDNTPDSFVKSTIAFYG